MDTLIRYFKGYIKISIEGEEKIRFLRLCMNHCIPLWNLDREKDKFLVRIFASDFKKLMPLKAKTGCRIHLCEKYGFPFFLYRNGKRVGLWTGILAAVCIFYLLSLFIWDIRISGNHYYSDERILEDIQKVDVFCGMKKADVDCKELARRLRMDHSGMVWTSVKVEGTCLIIEVKENEDSYKEPGKKIREEGEDILAPWDGTVNKIITRKGMPMVKEGDSFKKGDVLVRGQIDILNEDGQVERSQPVIPDADIVIRTTFDYYDEFPLEYRVKQYMGKEKSRPYIKIFNKRILLGRLPSGEEAGKEIICREAPVCLTPVFCLPLSVGRETVKQYIWKKKHYLKEEAQKAAGERIAYRMRRMAEENIHIYDKNITVDVQNNRCIAKGSFDIIITM